MTQLPASKTTAPWEKTYWDITALDGLAPNCPKAAPRASSPTNTAKGSDPAKPKIIPRVASQGEQSQADKAERKEVDGHGVEVQE